MKQPRATVVALPLRPRHARRHSPHRRRTARRCAGGVGGNDRVPLPAGRGNGGRGEGDGRGRSVGPGTQAGDHLRVARRADAGRHRARHEWRRDGHGRFAEGHRLRPGLTRLPAPGFDRPDHPGRQHDQPHPDHRVPRSAPPEAAGGHGRDVPCGVEGRHHRGPGRVHDQRAHPRPRGARAGQCGAAPHHLRGGRRIRGAEAADRGAVHVPAQLQRSGRHRRTPEGAGREQRHAVVPDDGFGGLRSARRGDRRVVGVLDVRWPHRGDRSRAESLCR